MPINNQSVPELQINTDSSGFPCAGYARFSSEKQRESSIEDQVRECRQEAKRLGGYIPEANIFADRDVRGALEHRPGLDRLMEIVRSGSATFHDLLISDTSRLARNSALAPKLRKFFKHYDIRLHFVENGMKSGSSGFDLQHTLQSYIDEQFSQQLGEKVLRGQIGLVLKGRTPSGRCYGYRNVPEEHPTEKGLWGRPRVEGVHKAIIPEEAKIVQQIFTMYAEGAGGYSIIAQTLNQQGVLSPRKAQKNEIRGWNHAAVKTILQNERYRGKVIFGRMKTTRDPETYKIKHKKRPESEWATHYDPDIRIISDELWAAAQARRELLCEKSGSRKAGGMARSQASRGYLFSGLLHCGCCGSSMVLKNGPGPRGSYHCTSAIRKTGCDNLQKIRRQPLERYLIDQIAATIRSVANFNDVKKLFMTELATQLKRQQEMVENAGQNEDTLLKERVKITSDLENLAEEIADYGGSDTIRSVMRRKEARLSIIAKELHQVQTPIRQVPEDEVDAFLKKEFEDLADLLLGDPIRSKLELQKRVNKLTLTPIKHDGAPAYMITGDIDLFSDHEAVLLGRNRDNTPKQHQFAIKLDGFVLRLDEHGVVTACSSIPLSAVEAENVLSKAA